MGMVLFMLVPFAALAYICWHVWCLLPLANGWRTAAVAVVALSFFLMFTILSRTIDRLPMALSTAVYEISTSSLIIMLYLFMLFMVLDLLRVCHAIPRTLLYNNWYTLGGIAVVMIAVFVYGNLHYRHKYRQPLELTTRKPLPREQKVIMVSDLHLGYHNPRKELARWVDMLNAEQADLILIAGDIIDMSVRPLVEEDMAQEMRRLQAPVYACLGNHEYYSGEPEAQRFFREAHIHLLCDSAAVVNGLCIIGRDDRTNPRRQSLADIMQKADRSRYTIVLDHQPYHLEKAEQAGVDFQFSGHTHHGQVWPLSWVTEAIYECAFGPHERGNTRYYVSSGLGIWGGKFRIGTRSEYIVATISNKTTENIQ
ncbi:MAG: metallophosphoesterase [Bacteroidaceae bacterium]|nr:metallophosphoesterase [Bacteroidaceae bacterium]